MDNSGLCKVDNSGLCKVDNSGLCKVDNSGLCKVDSSGLCKGLKSFRPLRMATETFSELTPYFYSG